MPTATETTRAWVYDLNDGSAEMRELLGNKGANLAEMTRVLGPEKVPGGFTITTAACVEYMRNGGQLPAGLDDQIAEARRRCSSERSGQSFGDPDDPLLLSVRSGAPVSMPGMLDTDPQPRADRGLGRGPGPAHRQRPLRLGLPPPPRADVLRGGQGSGR